LHQQLDDVPIGHFKILIGNESRHVKISFVTLEDGDWQSRLPPVPEGRAQIGLNIRAQMKAESLQQIVEQSLAGLKVQNLSVSAFHPRWPTPTHRMMD
jgi:hypothetical protein